MGSRLVERDWAIRDVYLQRFAVTALPRQLQNLNSQNSILRPSPLEGARTIKRGANSTSQTRGGRMTCSRGV